ncbi:MAG TPA: BamA/TamA family outer membrane protein [Gemmatimonadales bacterium]|nr:BamA/TamA family outer membrane protein [Gemmatimonadales bacterium]
MFRLVARSIRGALALASLGALALARPPQASSQSGTDAWRPQTVPLWGASYSPDIGLLVGAGITHTRYGFRALPASTRLLAEAAYASSVHSFRLDLAGEFRRPLFPAMLFVELRASGLERTRFYGTGNETDGSRPDSVYRVRQTQLLLQPRVAIPLAPRLRLTLGPLLGYTHTPVDAGTVLALARPYGPGDFGQIGARAALELDTRDVPAAPARGLHLSLASQWYPALWDVGSPFASWSAEASTYLSAGDPPVATLALRAGGTAVSGTVPFQELVYVGGETTVRGYAEQRFAGRRGAYGNVELRLPAGRLPFADVGIFGLADAGRVWTTEESSDRWHAAGGGGLWLAWQHRRATTLSVAVARSPERTAVYVRAGFMF